MDLNPLCKAAIMRIFSLPMDDLVHIEYSDAGHRVKGVLNYCDGILTIERVVGDV